MVSLVSNAPTLPVAGGYTPSASPSAVVAALQSAAGLVADQQLPEAVAATGAALPNAKDLPQPAKPAARAVINGAANGLMTQMLMQQGELSAEEAAIFAPTTELPDAPEASVQALVSNLRQDPESGDARPLPGFNPATAQAALQGGPIRLAPTTQPEVPAQRFTLPGRKAGLSDAKGAAAYDIVTRGTFMVTRAEGIEAAV